MMQARAFRTATATPVQGQRATLPRGRTSVRVFAADWRSQSAGRGRESQSRTAPVPEWKLSPRQRQQLALQKMQGGSSSYGSNESSSWGSSSAAAESSWSTAPSYQSSGRSTTPSAGYRRERVALENAPLPPWKQSPRKLQQQALGSIGSGSSSYGNGGSSRDTSSNTGSSWNSSSSYSSASNAPSGGYRRESASRENVPLPPWKQSPRKQRKY